MEWISTYDRLPTKEESKQKILVLNCFSYPFSTTSCIYDHEKKCFIRDDFKEDRVIERIIRIEHVLAFLPLKKYKQNWIPISQLPFYLKNQNSIYNGIIRMYDFFVKYKEDNKQVYDIVSCNSDVRLEPYTITYPMYTIKHAKAEKIEYFMLPPKYNLINFKKLNDLIVNTISKDLKLFSLQFTKKKFFLSKDHSNNTIKVEFEVLKTGDHPDDKDLYHIEAIDFTFYDYEVTNFERLYSNFLIRYKYHKEHFYLFFSENHISKFKTTKNTKK